MVIKMSLKSSPLFSDIPSDELTDMLKCLNGVIRHYEKNRIIFNEGELLTSIGIVLSGNILVFHDDSNGKRSIISTVYAPDTFGETYACAGIEILPVSIAANETCDVLLLDRRRMYSPCTKACACHRQLIQNLLRIIAQKNLMLNQKIEVMSKKTTKEKIMSYLMNEAEKVGANTFTLHIDRQTMADYLGVERTAMSAEIGKLCREGKIVVNRREFTILNDK